MNGFINLLEFIFASLTFLIYTVFVSKRYIHMLQLNSYYPSRYIHWIRENKKNLLTFSAAVPALAGLLFFAEKAIFPLAIFIYIILIFARDKKKAKKPLVYTSRVKRLYVPLYVLYALAVCFAGMFCNSVPYISVFIYAFAGLITPYLVLAALIINKPAERLINLHYYNDAKKKLRSMNGLIVIGVTGSYGKTSTKYILTRLLSEKYNVLMTPGSYNTTLGVVRTIREQLKSTHQIFVVEMGAKNKGDIKEICNLVNPKYGIISSIGPQHLETFKTIENIIDAKFELGDAVKANGGIMFLNYDNDYIKSRNFDGQKITYGFSECADYKTSLIKASERGTEFSVNGFSYQTKLLGKLNAVNIAAAVAVCEKLGVSPNDIAVAVRRLESTPHRLQLIHSPKYIVIDDAYNSNPQGAKSALETLSAFSERKILVTPGMVELGAKQEELNKEFGRQAAASADYIVLVGEKQAGPIKEGVIEAGFDKTRLYVAKNLEDALAFLQGITDVPSVVLLENDLPDNFL
ncbi:MAG: UDP-N-acetylmuramoyl-tripeptide--D-alanyl-D-alanine ligase [Bacillota bacterium]|nr:UDP-N-acetylmuramoyl-tripeptide--D-alanyl-D-alanine ligase [Bacillota bacterium]